MKTYLKAAVNKAHQCIDKQTNEMQLKKKKTSVLKQFGEVES